MGHFTTEQRVDYKANKLSAERIKILESLPDWSWEQNRNDMNFKLLKQYAKKHGHTLVPKSTKINGHDLGQFVCRNRSNYKKGILPQKMIQRFNQVPHWIWKRNSPDWQDYFFCVRMKCDVDNGFFITQTTEIDDLKIGAWCNRQRLAYKKRKLDQSQINQLESIKGWDWNPSKTF